MVTSIKSLMGASSAGLVRAGWLLVLMGSVSACSGSDSLDGDGGSSGEGGDDGGGAGTQLEDPGCEGPLGPPQDPASLPECCPEYGAAHCLDGIPAELQAAAATCDGGGYCVPDVFISTGGVYTPKACESIGGPGVCLSACIPAVADNIALLPQADCEPNERCIPCINPLDDLPTGACDLAFSCEPDGHDDDPPPPSSCDDPATCEYDLETTCAGEPANDPELFPPCPAEVCGGGGHCVPTAALPADQVDLLTNCDDNAKCVPDTLIKTNGNFIPPSCRSVNNAEGRCLSTCLPDVAAQVALLPTDTCLAEERCVPCYDPVSGDSTGACELSCDTGPVEPPVSFASCCAEEGGGTCLPVELVGADAARLDGEECAALGQPGTVCVPTVLYAAHAQGQLYNPEECETGFFAQFAGASPEGACLPLCIPEVGDTFGLSQSDCMDGFNCVPCIDQNGDNTGACQPQ